MAKSLPLKAFVFDILYKDGQSLIDEPLTKRMEILKQVLPEDDVLIRTKNQTITDAKVCRSYWKMQFRRAWKAGN